MIVEKNGAVSKFNLVGLKPCERCHTSASRVIQPNGWGTDSGELEMKR